MKLSKSALRQRLLESVERQVDGILKIYHPGGRFGTEPWIVRDQEVILPLAVGLTTPESRYFGDAEVLRAVAEGGRFLTEQQDKLGMYVFRKKDGSTWGDIYMPWTYLRWVFTFGLIREYLQPEDLEIWETGLLRGYEGIAATELTVESGRYRGHPPPKGPPTPGVAKPWLHNIPTHHAAGLFKAGILFERPEWKTKARDYLHLIVAEQIEDGWWTERSGPVVVYNQVYLDSLSIYYHTSGDGLVGAALERGNRYHYHTTYPDGSFIETFDERNYTYPVAVMESPDGNRTYHPPLVKMHPGLYASAEGRALIAFLLEIHARRGSPIPNAEMMLLFQPEEPFSTDGAVLEPEFTMGSDAVVLRDGPWVNTFSAYTAERTSNRFIQDRQNFFSLFHQSIGLLFGGGNTKIQPLWSTLTVGHPGLVSPVGSTADSELVPDSDLDYVAETARLLRTASGRGVRLESAGAILELQVILISDERAEVRIRLLRAAPDGRPACCHIPLIPYPGERVGFADETEHELEEDPWVVEGVSAFDYCGWHFSVEPRGKMIWPARAHNPYTKDGHSALGEARLVLSLPLDEEKAYRVCLEGPKDAVTSPGM